MYAASKHALGALSEALAGEVSPFNVRVVCIEPGFFTTEIGNNGLNSDDDREQRLCNRPRMVLVVHGREPRRWCLAASRRRRDRRRRQRPRHAVAHNGR